MIFTTVKAMDLKAPHTVLFEGRECLVKSVMPKPHGWVHIRLKTYEGVNSTIIELDTRNEATFQKYSY